MYYRLYVTYELLSWMFEVDVSNLNRLVHRLEPVLAQHLNPQPPTPLKRRLRNWEEFHQAYPELTEVVIDGTIASHPASALLKAAKAVLLEKAQTPHGQNSDCSDTQWASAALE